MAKTLLRGLSGDRLTMAEACRDEIARWWILGKTGENAGLLRDRYLRWTKDKNNHPAARKNLFEAMSQSLHISKGIYTPAYERQEFRLKDFKSRGYFTTVGRLVIGLGGENVLETGILLNHIYGTPMIPGTALKGLAAHYCHQVWGSIDDNDNFKFGGEFHRIIFGNTEESGHIIFHDAWITPESLEGSLQLDVMTPHHSDYYSHDKDETPPTDFDDPKPITFLSIVGTFHLVVSCDVPGDEGEKWADLAFGMLSEALGEWGIGGKTNAGYGRLGRHDERSTAQFPAKAASSEQAVKMILESQVGPKHKKGEKIEVTRAADPNVKRNNAYFKADDGFGGFVQFGIAPCLNMGENTTLEVAGVMKEGYAFAVPGSREDRIQNRNRRGKR